MPDSPAAHYASLVEAYGQQRLRLGQQAGFDRWSAAAPRFRDDPLRPLDETLELIASYVQPEDTLIDIGGGAGRFCLPLALRCNQVINVEPAAGMGREFEASAGDAGITNARWVESDWLTASGVEGDVSLAAHVTYFVADIVPFIEKLVVASRRRVILLVSSTPPPNQGADLFAVVQGEAQALVPGHRELLPALWDMGILPDVQVMGSGGAGRLALPQGRIFAGREEAIEAILTEQGVAADRREQARSAVGRSFADLFTAATGGYVLRTQLDARLMLITWKTGG